jgi:hypothetical protein
MVDNTTIDNSLDLYIFWPPCYWGFAAIERNCCVAKIPGGTIDDGPILRVALVLIPSITGES